MDRNGCLMKLSNIWPTKRHNVKTENEAYGRDGYIVRKRHACLNLNITLFNGYFFLFNIWDGFLIGNFLPHKMYKRICAVLAVGVSCSMCFAQKLWKISYLFLWNSILYLFVKIKRSSEFNKTHMEKWWSLANKPGSLNNGSSVECSLHYSA